MVSGDLYNSIGFVNRITGHKVASGAVANSIVLVNRITGWRIAARIRATARALIPTRAAEIHPHPSQTAEPGLTVEALLLGVTLLLFAVARAARRVLRAS